MQSLALPIRSDAHDFLAPQGAFVHSSGCDPDVSILGANGDVAAGGRGHPVAIDELHRTHDLVSWMEERTAVGGVRIHF